MRRFVLPILLSLLAASVVVGALTLANRQLKKIEARELAGGQIHKLSVSRITIKTGSSPAVSVVNSAPVQKDWLHAAPVISDRSEIEKWRVEPPQLKLNYRKLDAYLTAVLGIVIDSAVPGADDQLTGLTQPRAAIDIEHMKGKETITFGRPHADRRRWYAKLASRPGTWLLDGDIRTALTAPVE